MSAAITMAKRPATAVWRSLTRPVGSVREVRTSDRVVVLTFDDGPEPGSTDRVLESLAAHRATATFFVLMTRVRRARDLVGLAVASGHEVALHGPDHVRLTSLSGKEIVDRSRAAKEELEDIAGRPVRWLRPPYGSQSLGSWAAVRRAGLTPVVWGGTTWDWRDIPTHQRLEVAMRGVRPGQIVLAHDCLAGIDDGAEPRAPFALDRGAFVDELLVAYHEHGYSALSLADALARGGQTRQWAWFGR